MYLWIEYISANQYITCLYLLFSSQFPGHPHMHSSGAQNRRSRSLALRGSVSSDRKSVSSWNREICMCLKPEALKRRGFKNIGKKLKKRAQEKLEIPRHRCTAIFLFQFTHSGKRYHVNRAPVNGGSRAGEIFFNSKVSQWDRSSFAFNM